MAKNVHVTHPILRLEVIDQDGRRRLEHRVFCRYRQEAVPVMTCCACLHCEGVTSAPAVECSIALEEASEAPDRAGIHTPVGQLLTEGTFAVNVAMALRDAFALLRAEDRRSVAVVDNDHVTVGVLHESIFSHPVDPGAEVGTQMSSRLVLVDTTPVRRALQLLASAHLREATIVSETGTPLGVFRDLDGIRWLTRLLR